MAIKATVEEEAAFEAFLQGTSHLMALLEEDGSVRWVSPSVQYLLGWSQEEFCAEHPIHLMHPDDAAFVTELMTASGTAADRGLDADDARLAVDVRVKHRDGRWVTMEVMGNNLLGAPGINGRMVVARDVTVRRAMDDALTALADTLSYEEVISRILDFLELTVSGTAAAVWWPGHEPAWTTRHVPEALLTDLGPWTSLPGDGSHLIIEDLKQAVTDGRLDSDLGTNAIDAGFSACWSVPVPRPNDHDTTWASPRKPVAWRSPSGALVIWSRKGGQPLIGHGVAMNRGAAMIFFAMTHYQVAQERASQLERQRRQNHQLAEINAMRTDLFLTMSHDLRTPLASISGAADMLAEEGDEIDPVDRATYLGMIGHNTSRMLHMVDDLLLLAKLDAEGLQPAHEDVDLAAVAVAAVEDVRPAAQAKGVDLSLEVSDGPSLRGDSDQLRHLVDNLVSNAVKFTPSGGQISVQTGPSEEGWELVVSDDGIGIPPAEQAQIFDRFARGSNARAAHIAGSGLGLVIARAVARGHGGDITVESEEGQGARFLVTLRCSEEAPAVG